MKKFYKIRTDIVFKSIFCKEENRCLLEALIKEVIGEELCSTKMSEMDEEKWKCYDDILCNTDGVDIFAHISK